MSIHTYRVWDIPHEAYVGHILIAQDGTLLLNLGDKIVPSLEPERYRVQYGVGVPDKNGKEIVEGDFLKVDWRDSRYPIHTIGPVAWDTREARWSLGEGGSAKHDAEYYMEVIGNICENPEMLSLVLEQ